MKPDERTVGRYVDGEMGRDEQVAFEVTLREEPELHGQVSDASALRALFVPGRREAGPAPSRDFRARVLAAVAATAPEPAAADVERWSRRVLYAAAAILALCLLTAYGLLHRPETGRLEASPAELERAMEQLDANVRAEAVHPGDREGR